MQRLRRSREAGVVLVAVLVWWGLCATAAGDDTRSACIYAGRTAAEWRALLGSHHRVVRLTALKALGELHQVDVLLQQLDSPDPAARYWAAFYLRFCRPLSRDAVAKLTARLNDPDAMVRVTAAATLVRLGDGSSLSAIVKELNNPQMGVVVWALTELRDLGRKAAEAEPGVRRRLTSNVSYYRRLAQEFLRRLGYKLDIKP